MFELLILIGVAMVIFILVFLPDARCPSCGGKLIDDDYDKNINKVVWTCKKCGEKWILY